MRKALFILFFASTMTGVLSGCQKKRGCTDVNSDNYDPAAEQDDDTCIPMSLKFVGKYDGHGTIETGLDTLVAYDQVAINIQDSTVFAANSVIIGLSNFDAPLYALSATISGLYGLNVTRQSLGSFTYYGDGNINGRVLELNMTRIEEIPYDTWTDYDTLYLNLYGIKQLD